MLNDQLYILFMSNIFTGRARCQHIYLEKVSSWTFEVWTHLDPAASLAITIGTEQNRWAWNCSQALETNMCHMHARNYDWNDRLFPNDYEHGSFGMSFYYFLHKHPNSWTIVSRLRLYFEVWSQNAQHRNWSRGPQRAQKD